MVLQRLWNQMLKKMKKKKRQNQLSLTNLLKNQNLKESHIQETKNLGEVLERDLAEDQQLEQKIKPSLKTKWRKKIMSMGTITILEENITTQAHIINTIHQTPSTRTMQTLNLAHLPVVLSIGIVINVRKITQKLQIVKNTNSAM